jgi:uncharacterized protein
VNSASKNGNLRQDTVILAVLTLPFLLNDFSNIFVRDYRLWLVIDYVFVKAFPIAVVIRLLRSKKLTFSDLGLRRIGVGRFLIWTIAMTFVGTILDQLGSRFLAQLLPDTRMGGMPPITNPLVNQVDLYVGLAFVALVEEVVFRGLYFTALSAHLGNLAAVFLVSASAFGLIHWSLGISAVAHTAVIGAVFMVCLWRTGSAYPTIAAHFFVNYVAFSGVLNH